MVVRSVVRSSSLQMQGMNASQSGGRTETPLRSAFQDMTLRSSGKWLNDDVHDDVSEQSW